MGCLGRNDNEMQKLEMHKMKVIAGMLIMIALAGLPAGVQAEGDDDRLIAADIWRERI